MKNFTKIINNPSILITKLQRKWNWFLNVDYSEIVFSVYSFIKFILFKPDSKTVLIVEPHQYHAEILPGYCQYFQDLGFKVILIMRKKNVDSNVFSRYEIQQLPLILCMNIFFMKISLNLSKLKDIKFIFLSSGILAEKYGAWGDFFQYIKYTPKSLDSYLVVMHDLDHYFNTGSRYTNEDRIVVLTEYNKNGYHFPMINPHYFGKIAKTNLSMKNIFITVGAVSSENRNFSELLSAVNKLLIEGITNFKVLVIGRIENPQELINIPKQIELLGPVTFDQLYDSMECADFFLTLLDPENKRHRRYLDVSTTGSRQLILGFTKVPIIHREFAEAYGFSEDNSIIQQENSLDISMKMAMELNADEYKEKQQQLTQLSKAIYRKSLDNLREKISH